MEICEWPSTSITTRGATRWTSIIVALECLSGRGTAAAGDRRSQEGDGSPTADAFERKNWDQQSLNYPPGNSILRTAQGRPRPSPARSVARESRRRIRME